LMRGVRAAGGLPVLLPGMALRGAPDSAAARKELLAALGDEFVLFTSPAAVRFAARLAPLRTRAEVLAVGQGTARALRRHSISVSPVPSRQDSEGLLQHAALAAVRGRRVALVGAPGGRGLLRRELLARGADVREVHVYRRVPARLDRRHFDALLHLPQSACVLLSSAEALHNLQDQLPEAALARWLATTAVVSSERLAAAARAAGFARVVCASSALSADLLAGAQNLA
ncbi:MAG: uroporphyrinogen-III synthase, partial [Rhodanobacter sp.]